MPFIQHPVFLNVPTINPQFDGGCSECDEIGAGGPCNYCSYHCDIHLYAVGLCTFECINRTYLRMCLEVVLEYEEYTREGDLSASEIQWRSELILNGLL